MSLRDHLQKAITQLPSNLNSRKARARFAASMTYGRHFGNPAWNAKPASVLILFHNDNGRMSIPFTVRPKALREHGGQVSLPGGRQERDETSEEAALREFREELGCSTDQIQILGCLNRIYVYNSNFYVTPWVAWSNDDLEFTPNPSEVEKVFSMPAKELVRPENYSSFTVNRGAVSFEAPSIEWQEFRIWGATCVILGEVVTIIEDFATL